MVVLKVMLDRGVDDWYQPITPEQAASEFHQYLTEKEYRKRIDLSDKTGKSIWTYNEKGKQINCRYAYDKMER